MASPVEITYVHNPACEDNHPAYDTPYGQNMLPPQVVNVATGKNEMELSPGIGRRIVGSPGAVGLDSIYVTAFEYGGPSGIPRQGVPRTERVVMGLPDGTYEVKFTQFIVCAGTSDVLRFTVGAVAPGASGPGAGAMPGATGPAANACLARNKWFIGPDQRRVLHEWEMADRAAAKQLAHASQVLDVFWYLERILATDTQEGKDLVDGLSDSMDAAEAQIDEAAANVATASKETNAAKARLDAATRAMRTGAPTAKGRQALAAELLSAKKAFTAATSKQSAAQLKMNQISKKAVARVIAFIRKHPVLHGTLKVLGVFGTASEMAHYLSWASELWASFERELRTPPPGCPIINALPPGVTSRHRAHGVAAATPSLTAMGLSASQARAASALKANLAEQIGLLDLATRQLSTAAGKGPKAKATRALLPSRLARLATLRRAEPGLRLRFASLLALPLTLLDDRQAAAVSGYRQQPPARRFLRRLVRGQAPSALIATARATFAVPPVLDGSFDLTAAFAAADRAARDRASGTALGQVR